MRVVKELFIAMFWVFFILILGYLILDFVVNRNIPLASSFGSWIERHSQPSAS